MTEDVLQLLFAQATGVKPEEVIPLPASASNRRYFRLSGGGKTLVGTIGTSLEENRAFIYIARHLREKGLKVPAVLAVSEDGSAYLQEDLGGSVLFDLVSQGRKSGEYSADERSLLKKAIAELPRIQYLGGEGMDWSVCYPQEAFDARMVDFDLNYFKYCYLKLTGLEFNENLLQNDFEKLKADLLQEEGNTFLYRDFQARNVIIRDGEPWFYDFQGGRRGPVYYDLASFVWQARSRFPEDLKEELIGTYLEALKAFRPVDEADFRRKLRLFVLFRTLQVLGAYGFRGYHERKPAFIASIPFALKNLRELLPVVEYPYLDGILQELSREKEVPAPEDGLTVTVYSFAYKKGLPADESGNGGGYIFDCRSIHNAGRYQEYKSFCGTDAPVVKFLEDDGEVMRFLEHVYALVDAHVERYLKRGFHNLQVSFGCTGGQHRSVYCAQHVAEHLAAKYDIKVVLRHREQGIEKVL